MLLGGGNGGETGIRTLGGLAPTTVFETVFDIKSEVVTSIKHGLHSGKTGKFGAESG